MSAKVCKDCVAEVAAGTIPKIPVRKLARKRGGVELAPGPRCVTHHREVAKAAALRARNRRIGQMYGLDDEGADYTAIYEAQGGRCYICRRATGATKFLAVDHNHTTGKVRGLLCGPCNRGVLGHLRDSTEALQRAITYLRDEPAQAVLLALDTPEEAS